MVKPKIQRPYVTSVAVSPLKGKDVFNKVYVGTEPSALYSSNDGGNSWEMKQTLNDLPSSKSWSFPPRPWTHPIRWIEPGIMFSRNMFNSIARNNFVSNEDNGIVISESHNNEVYNNVISDSGSGIDIDEDSFENIVYNNTIINIPEPSEALYLRDGASEENTLHSNVLINADQETIALDEPERKES